MMAHRYRPPPAELIIQQPDKTEKRFVRSSRRTAGPRVDGGAGDATDSLTRLVMDCPPYTASFNDLLTHDKAAENVDGQCQLAILVHARMHKELIPINAITYNALIRLAVHGNDDTIFDFYEEFKDVSLHGNSNMQPDLQTFENLLRACERSSLFPRAFVLYQQMHELFHLTPDVSVYNTLLGFCTASKDVAQATYLVSEMKRNGVALDISTYNFFLTVLVHTAPYSEMLRVFHEMKDHGLQPTIRVVNTMLVAARVQGDYDRAFQLFEDMKRQGVVPDLMTYNNLFCTCEQRLDGILGEGGYAHVRRSRAQRNHGTRAMAELVLTLLAQMPVMGVEPNTLTYNKVLTILLRCRDDRIFAVYKDVQLAYDTYTEAADWAAHNMATVSPTVAATRSASNATETPVVRSLCHTLLHHPARVGDSTSDMTANCSTAMTTDVGEGGTCPVADNLFTSNPTTSTRKVHSERGVCSDASGTGLNARKSMTRISSRHSTSDSSDGQSLDSTSVTSSCSRMSSSYRSRSKTQNDIPGVDYSADSGSHPTHTPHRTEYVVLTASTPARRLLSAGRDSCRDEHVHSGHTHDTHAETSASLAGSFLDHGSQDCSPCHTRLLGSLTGESEMQLRGVQPTAEAYCCMLQAYLATKQLEPCRALYNTIRKVHKLLLTREVAMVVLKICASLAGGDRAWAECVMDVIRSEELFVDTALYNSYLRVLAAKIGSGGGSRNADDADLIAELEERFAEMKMGINEFGAQANCETYNVMLDAYTRAGRLGDARDLFAAMRESYSAIQPNDETYCCMMNLCEARRNSDDVRFILDYMYSAISGKQPPPLAQQQQGCRYGAVSLRGMTKLGICVFHRLMKLYAFLDDGRRIDEVFTLLRGRDTNKKRDCTNDSICDDAESGRFGACSVAAMREIDATTHTSMSALASVGSSTSEHNVRSGPAVEACSHTTRVLPPIDTACYTIMMQFCVTHAQYDRVQKLFYELMSSEQLEPDVTAYHLMFQTYSKLEDHQSIADLFEETRIHEVKLGLDTYEVIIESLISTTDSFLYNVLEDMNANGIHPADSTFALFLISNEGRQKLSSILARKIFSQPVQTLHFWRVDVKNQT